ncbi:hypothetical protein ABW20_dc0103518 [Dactylellina cionopaga]|nr:hypothetical protein ABW20_dc0103518 [Dactylellina cionopaga]
MQLGTTLGSVEVDPYSKLAAVYVNESTRRVFYQITGDKDSCIGMADPVVGTNGAIQSTSGVLDKSPITACAVGDSIWVYYLDTSRNIKKLILSQDNVAQGSAGMNPGPLPSILNGDTPLNSSLLSANPSPSSSKTYLTYAVPPEENPKMRCYVDEWPATSSWLK